MWRASRLSPDVVAVPLSLAVEVVERQRGDLFTGRLLLPAAECLLRWECRGREPGKDNFVRAVSCHAERLLGAERALLEVPRLVFILPGKIGSGF